MADKQALTKRPPETQALIEREAHIEAKQDQEQRDQANRVLGGLYAVSALNKMIGAQTMHGWQRFFEEGLHLTLGYKGVDHFLTEAPEAPMSKHQWYDRREALEGEGDTTFDLLNSIRIPLSARKALPPDAFEVREDQLVITDENGDEYEIPLSDSRRIKAVIANIARDLDKKKRELTQTIKTADALMKRNKELADAKPKPSNELATPHGEALLFAITALNHLAEKADDLSDEDAIQLRGNAIESIGQVMTKLHTAYRFSLEKPGTAAPRKTTKLTDKQIQEALGD